MPVTTRALLSVTGFLLIGKAPYIWLISAYCLIACANNGLQLQACRVRVQCKVSAVDYNKKQGRAGRFLDIVDDGYNSRLFLH